MSNEYVIPLMEANHGLCPYCHSSHEEKVPDGEFTRIVCACCGEPFEVHRLTDVYSPSENRMNPRFEFRNVDTRKMTDKQEAKRVREYDF
jgi:predicted amidophosphoribosyltransferase